MSTFISLFHSGSIRMDKIGSCKFVGMKRENFLVLEFPRFEGLFRLMRERLGWMEQSYDVCLEGQIDVGSSNGPRIKAMAPMCDENEWTAYVGVVMKSKVRSIELVARKVLRNVVCDENLYSPTLPDSVDQQPIECVDVLTQPSQASHHERARVLS